MTTLEVCHGRTGMESALAQILQKLQSPTLPFAQDPLPQSPNDFWERERAWQAWGREQADLAIAATLLRAHLDSPQVSAACRSLRHLLRLQGATRFQEEQRRVSILLPGGFTLRLSTSYLRPRKATLQGKAPWTGDLPPLWLTPG